MSSDNLTDSEKKESSPTSASAPIKVLLVDDDNNYRYMVRSMLETSGRNFEFIECFNGEDTLKLLELELPKLILLDINMPLMDGEQLLREIQALELSVPIILSSSNVGYEEDLIKKGLGEGVDFLSKGYRCDELLRLVEKRLT